jgi:hypothetical protein
MRVSSINLDAQGLYTSIIVSALVGLARGEASIDTRSEISIRIDDVIIFSLSLLHTRFRFAPPFSRF